MDAARERAAHRSQVLGYDYSTFITQVFVVALLRGYTWDVPEQSKAYRWDRTPAEPRDGLRMTMRTRA